MKLAWTCIKCFSQQTWASFYYKFLVQDSWACATPISPAEGLGPSLFGDGYTLVNRVCGLKTIFFPGVRVGTGSIYRPASRRMRMHAVTLPVGAAEWMCRYKSLHSELFIS